MKTGTGEARAKSVAPVEEENGNSILAYYQGIRNGSVTVGRWIRLLYELIVTGLEEKRWFFDQRKAGNAIRFIEKYCHHSKGPMAPQRLRLTLWQKATVSLIFGIVDSEGRRQFREVMILVGRKMGKTLLAAAITSYIAYVDGEFGSEIYFLAPKLDQADLCFSAFEFNVNHEPAMQKRTKSTKTRGLYIAESNTSVKKLPFSDRKSDGYNPMLFTADEVSSWKAERGLKQWEVMISGMGARREPLGVAISSAGYVDGGVFDELIKRGTAFLNGDSRESHLLPVLYMIDDPEKWDDINELRKSLPGLGESVSVDFILNEIDTAYQSISKKTEFLTKYCNIKQNSSMAWLSSQDLRKCFGIGGRKDDGEPGAWTAARIREGKIGPQGNRLTFEDFRHSYALGGIDLSQTVDLTAAVIMIQKDGVNYFFTRFFMPAEKIDEATARDGLPYRVYVERGLLVPSGENFVDYRDVENWFSSLRREWEIVPLLVGYDRYSAQYLVDDMKKSGFQMDDVFQGPNLTGVLNDMEGMIKDGTLQCADDNDLMKIHMMDSALAFESNSNRKKLVKIAKTRHIDGMAALSDAMCMHHNKWDELQNLLRNAR